MKKTKNAPFHFLPHTADIMMEAQGKSYLEALENSALAMFSVLGEAKPKVKFTITEAAANNEELVVYVLSRILAECDAREIVGSKTEVLGFDATKSSITMAVYGEKKRARDHIKAVTFHELSVAEDEKGIWKIRVLFDV